MKILFKDEDCRVEVLEENKSSRQIKAYVDEMMMVEVFFENNAEGYLHQHIHTQLTYCLEGEFVFTINDESFEIKAGDTIYMPPNSVHGCKLISKRGRLLDVFTPSRQDFLDN